MSYADLIVKYKNNLYGIKKLGRKYQHEVAELERRLKILERISTEITHDQLDGNGRDYPNFDTSFLDNIVLEEFSDE